MLSRRQITKNERNAARTLGDHNPDAGRQQTYFVAAIPTTVALHTGAGAYETYSSPILTSLHHPTREPFKLHVGSEARHSQRPDPQIPAKTPLQACRVLQSDGGEYGRGWTNPYRLRSALVVRTPSFAVAGARSPATPSFPWLGRFVDAPPRRRLAWTWILGARA